MYNPKRPKKYRTRNTIDTQDQWEYIKERLQIVDFYDFSDTLAKVDWQASNIPAAIIAAKALYKPSGNFAVITAQQDNPTIHKAVLTWLNTHYGERVTKVYFVTGGEANIVKAKSRILSEQRANSFTDNNETILKGIRAELPNLPLYKATNGERRAWR